MMKHHAAGALFAIIACGQMFAAPSQVLGEQDFAHGAIVASDSNWLLAQTDETGPSTGLYTDFITYFHDVDPTALDGTLTFSLWDLDSSAPGNQVTAFQLDGVSQPIGAFETGEPNRSVKFFQFTVPGSLLGDGAVQVFLGLGPQVGGDSNAVGIDFSRLEVVVPEPTTLAIAASAILGMAGLRRRRMT